MAFKKHNWKDYKRNGEIVEITLKDQSGAKTGTFKANNQKDYSRVLKIIKDKIGYIPDIKQQEELEIKEEIDWLKKDIKW